MNNNIISDLAPKIQALGYEAYVNGAMPWDNPHARTTPEHGLWECGYHHAALRDIQLQLHEGRITLSEYRTANYKLFVS